MLFTSKSKLRAEAPKLDIHMLTNGYGSNNCHQRLVVLRYVPAITGTAELNRPPCVCADTDTVFVQHANRKDLTDGGRPTHAHANIYQHTKILPYYYGTRTLS